MEDIDKVELKNLQKETAEMGNLPERRTRRTGRKE